jgi:hypothetical protein
LNFSAYRSICQDAIASEVTLPLVFPNSNRYFMFQGIFRVAATGTRVKKLKAAFDASVVEIDEYKHDVHCIASAYTAHRNIVIVVIV